MRPFFIFIRRENAGRRKVKAEKRRTPSEGPPAVKEDIAEAARNVAESLCAAEGLELVHVEYQRESSGRTLRVYIDRSDGVTLDDCVAVSRQLNDLLDVYLETGAPYRLEVSSPGAERPLVKADDFVRFQGNTARIKTRRPIDGQRNFKGVILESANDAVKLMTENKTALIPLAEISRARLVADNGVV